MYCSFRTDIGAHSISVQKLRSISVFSWTLKRTQEPIVHMRTQWDARNSATSHCAAKTKPRRQCARALCFGVCSLVVERLLCPSTCLGTNTTPLNCQSSFALAQRSIATTERHGQRDSRRAYEELSIVFPFYVWVCYGALLCEKCDAVLCRHDIRFIVGSAVMLFLFFCWLECLFIFTFSQIGWTASKRRQRERFVVASEQLNIACKRGREQKKNVQRINALIAQRTKLAQCDGRIIKTRHATVDVLYVHI